VVEGFAHTSIRKNGDKEYVCAHFCDQQDVEQALKMDTGPLKNSKDEEVAAPTFILYTSIKPPKSDEDKRKERENMIQVIDIPLNYKGPDVRKTFERYGTINKLSMVTKGLYQQAYITFADQTAATHFTSQAWSTFIYQDAVRVLPLSLTKEERELRQQFCFKLAGIPRNTSARDLLNYLKSINAKTCFIPRNANNYNKLNYAYINFTSDEDLVKASETHHSFKGSPLYWVPADQQTCNFCGSPDHFAKGCNAKKHQTDRNKKYQNVYKRFRPAQHKSKDKKRNLSPTLLRLLTTKVALLTTTI
jgi:hypothetical protein